METKVVLHGAHTCELIHLASNSRFFTDSPASLGGAGSYFAPTDLIGAALASCVLTQMADAAHRRGIRLHSGQAGVSKTMSSSPRRITAIRIDIALPAELSADELTVLREAAVGCPVHQTLVASAIAITINFGTLP
ncbi:MAG: OsmC family protein [Bdellovibrionales bacterium]